jgi:hypothetical protein
MNELMLLDNLPAMDWKYKVAYLAHKLHAPDQVEAPVKHVIDGDEYIREVRYPADTIIIGRTHINGHLVQLVSGTVVNVTEAGQQELSGPFEFDSVPGYQVVCYTLTEIVARTVHKNPLGLTDWQQLEDRDFVPAAAILERGKMVEAKLIEAKLIEAKVAA